MSEQKMNRRSFLQASTVLGVGSVVGASALLSACSEDNKMTPLKQPGEFYVPPNGSGSKRIVSRTCSFNVSA